MPAAFLARNASRDALSVDYERVSVSAVCPSRYLRGWAFAAKRILAHRYGLKVGRTNAATIPTKVVKR